MYGFCIFSGVLVVSLLGERLCKKRDLDAKIYWRAVFFALIFGLFGARLYHILHRWDYFVARPLEILFLWQGGLGVWGAIFGGLAGFSLSFVKTAGKNDRRVPKLLIDRVLVRKQILAYLDIFAVHAPLAQAIGRWGNFFNKELFGYPTNLPWGIYIPPQLRPEQFKYFDSFHPLFLYESLLNFALFILLYAFYSRKFLSANSTNKTPFAGFFTLAYLFGYSLIRLSLEFLRIDSWKLFDFPVAGLIAIFIMFLTALILVKGTKTNDLYYG